MTSSPAYLPEVIQYVKSNIDAPARVALALAALLTDDASTTLKVGVSGALKDFVGHWLLTDPEASRALSEPESPVQVELIDGKWLPSWKASRRSTGSQSFKYSVCISFAGKDRAIAEGIARAITADAALGRRVFYDEFEKNDLWGQNLFERLHKVYSEESMFCVILFSHAYRQRAWTRHELRAAQTRILDERSQYVLPVAVDAGAIPPEFSSTGYWPYAPGDEATALPLAIEAKINDFIGAHYLSVEEIAEGLKREWIRRALLDAFRAAITASAENRAALFIVAIAVGWDATSTASADITAVIRLLLYSPGPVSEMFNGDALEIESGYFVRRTFGGNELFALSGNWLERVKTYFPADWDFDAEDEPSADRDE